MHKSLKTSREKFKKVLGREGVEPSSPSLFKRGNLSVDPPPIEAASRNSTTLLPVRFKVSNVNQQESVCPHPEKLQEGKTKIFTPRLLVHRSVTIGLTHPFLTSRVRTKGEAPFRGQSTLLPLDQTIDATVGSPIRPARGLASIEVYTEQDITLKAVSALGVPATLARRPREVSVKGITPLARLQVEGANCVDGVEGGMEEVFHYIDTLPRTPLPVKP